MYRLLRDRPVRVLLLWFLILPSLAFGGVPGDATPWGRATVRDFIYQPQKVVYDVTAANARQLTGVLDRVSLLSNLYGADPFSSSIVLVIHGDAIELFTRKHYPRYAELMKRAQSLTVGTTIDFRLCGASAHLRGYDAADFHGFITMVPMADAEIVRLQTEEGYAYMR